MAKSKFINKTATLKSASRTYTQGPEGITGRISAVMVDGSPFLEWQTDKIDGSYSPHMGNPLIDEMASERIDANTISFTGKIAGKIMGIGTRAISADGKVLTMTFVYTDAEGILRGHVTVYEKQGVDTATTLAASSA
ncbi:MAG: hypothetical protein E5W39_10160 [Mesorhizobium sp.]|nr:MAG: hypothetical protein E5W39_10160 [Mesorhizobium sp.]